MKIRNFVYSVLQEGDFEELNNFMATHRIYSLQKELIKINDGTYWTMLVQYEERKLSSEANSAKNNIDYKKVLNEEEFNLYSKLRDKRKELGDAGGIPLYAIATNEQLAEMAKNRPQTKSDFLKIINFGEGKFEKYSAAFASLMELQNK